MKRRLPAVLALAGVGAVLALLPFILSSYNTYLVAEVGVFFVAVLGVNLLTGYTGQISIGHGAFMAVGGYTTALLSRDHHMNLIVTLLFAFAFAFIAGLLFGLLALRLDGVYLALATFALAVSVPYVTLQWSSYFGGSGGVQSTTNKGNLWIYGIAWSSAAVMYALAWLIVRGRVGRAFRAVRDSEIAAVASGVETGIYKTLSFAISAAFCGVAGALYVISLNGFAQPQEFGLDLSLLLLVGAAIAGLGSLWGVLVGAVFIGLLPEISTSVPIIGSDSGRAVVYGALVIAVMLVLPGGFAGLLERLARSSRT